MDGSSFHHHAIVSTVETITPEIAEAYLKLNICNRPISSRIAIRYARDMVRGLWSMNGEAIQFNSRGELMNGQHRLTACIMGNVPFDVMVVRGLDPQAVATIDSGKLRRPSDHLAMRGVANSSAVASAVRWIILIRRISEWGATSAYIGNSITISDVLSEAEQLPGIAESLSVASSLKNFMGVGPLCALHYILSEASAPHADAFFTSLRSGAALMPNDPIWLLRERLLVRRLSKKTRAHRTGTQQISAADECIAAFIRAWNAHLRGERLMVLRGSIKSPGSDLILWPEIS